MKKSLVILLSLLIVSLLAGRALAEGSEISYGKSYTLITPASAAYPDNSAKLTDGIFGTLPDGSTSYYSSPSYVGFNQVDNCFCLGQIQMAVQKGSLGEFSPLGRQCACDI